jgi:hypothetical protein
MRGQSSFKTRPQMAAIAAADCAQREASMRGRGRFFGVRRWPTQPGFREKNASGKDTMRRMT